MVCQDRHYKPNYPGYEKIIFQTLVASSPDISVKDFAELVVSDKWNFLRLPHWTVSCLHSIGAFRNSKEHSFTHQGVLLYWKLRHGSLKVSSALEQWFSVPVTYGINIRKKLMVCNLSMLSISINLHVVVSPTLWILCSVIV